MIRSFDPLTRLLQPCLEYLERIALYLRLLIPKRDESAVEVDSVDLVGDLKVVAVAGAVVVGDLLFEDRGVDADEEGDGGVEDVGHVPREDRDEHVLPGEGEEEGGQGDTRVG